MRAAEKPGGLGSEEAILDLGFGGELSSTTQLGKDESIAIDFWAQSMLEGGLRGARSKSES